MPAKPAAPPEQGGLFDPPPASSKDALAKYQAELDHLYRVSGNVIRRDVKKIIGSYAENQEQPDALLHTLQASER